MSGKSAAFIGLGVMGYPMAGHCQKAGFAMTVFNRTTEKAKRWATEFDGEFKATPALAAQNVDFVLVCVGNDEDVRSVFYGDDGILSTLKAGAIVVDHTTTSAELARELYEAVKSKGASFVDAPVSGGQAGAENGQLSIMAGGDEAAFSRCEPLFDCYGKGWQLLGGSGSGQACKMVNQVCIAGIVQGLSEGIALAKKQGLAIDQVQKVLSGGAAQSWQLDNRAITMGNDEFDFGFAIDWMVKDLGYCLGEATSKGLDLPVAALVKSYYEELQDKGMNRCDTSALLRRLV
jgi:3-hydroxyisobutyrate dehydrogenase-like beta-hydroxyacid dehydrogenase